MKRSTREVAIPGVGGPSAPTGSRGYSTSTALPRNPLLWVWAFFAVLIGAPGEAWRNRHVMRPYVFDPVANEIHEAKVRELRRAHHVCATRKWVRGTWTTNEDGSQDYTGGYTQCYEKDPRVCPEPRTPHAPKHIPAPPPPPRFWVAEVTDTRACPYHHDTFDVVDAEEVAR